MACRCRRAEISPSRSSGAFRSSSTAGSRPSMNANITRSRTDPLGGAISAIRAPVRVAITGGVGTPASWRSASIQASSLSMAWRVW